MKMLQNVPFELKVGDYCKAYTKGIHRVLHILYPAKGRASTALVTLESVLDSKYNLHKGRKSQCDVAWCSVVTREQLLKEIENSHYSQINNVKDNII